MLPSYFSKILMYLILPAQHQPPTHSRFELTQVKSYSVSHQYISGLETYHAILDHKKDIQLYEVFFPGNAMDIGQVFLDDSGKSYSYIQYYLLNAIEKNKKKFCILELSWSW